MILDELNNKLLQQIKFQLNVELNKTGSKALR